MLYWRSNTVTTASIDYTNGALDEACYIGRASTGTTASILPTIIPTLEQLHLLIIPIRHWTKHVILLSNTGTTTSIDYTNGATLEQQHLLIIPMEHWPEHVILAEQHWNNIY